MGKAIDWESKRETIFEMMSGGEYTLVGMAEAVGVNKNALNHWWNRPQTRAAYNLWLITNGVEDKRMTKNRTVPQREDGNYISCRQEKAAQFKEELRIGQQIKNHHYHETGVVVAKYPHCFTIRTDEGYMSSYSYAACSEFIKQKV